MHCVHHAHTQVYDGSAEDGAPPNFVIVEELQSYWEVPLEGAGSPENPVPGPVGQLYASAGAVGNGTEVDGGFGTPLPEDAFGGAPIPDDAFGGADDHTLNGAMDYVRDGDVYVLLHALYCTRPFRLHTPATCRCQHRHQTTTPARLPCATCSASASRTKSSSR